MELWPQGCRISGWKVLSLLALSLWIAFFSSNSFAADIYSGATAAKDFTNTTLWVGGVVPGINDNAIITNGTNQTISWTIDTTNANAYINNVVNTKTLTIASSTWYVTNSFVVGQLAGTTGAVTLSTGKLVITNSTGTAYLDVGEAGKGTFTQTGTLIVDKLFSTNGANSTFLANNSGSTFTILHGSTIDQGSTFGLVSGGATWNILGGTNTIVGGTAIGGTGTSAGGGTVIVDGSGTLLSNAGNLVLGQTGAPNNTMIVTNGATVVVVGTASLGAGAGASTNETLLITGAGSLMTVTGSMTVGSTTLSNKMIVANGGTFSNGANTIIGNSGASGYSTLIVTNAGSSWTTTGFSIGPNGSPYATLTVTDGGVVTNLGTFTVGATASSQTNTVLVTGAGSLINNTGAMTVGSGGFNTITISNAGNMIVGGVTTIGNSTAGSSNNVFLITGTNTSFSSAGLVLGSSGPLNTMTVAAGAVVTNNGTVVIGSAAGSIGNTLLVTDAGSTFYSTNNFSVGSSGGMNSLVISNGGSVILNDSSASFIVGVARTSSTNSILITGDQSILQIGKSLLLGSNGTTGVRGAGSMLIQNGGTLEVNTITNGLTDPVLGATGVITNDGGIFQFTSSSPSIRTNTFGTIILTNGFISYRNVSDANIYAAAVSNITFQGNNTFRLNSSTNANVAYYVFSNGNGNLYQNLSMVNGNTRWDANGTVLGTGSTLSISNSIATFAGNITNTAGTITLAGGSTVTLGPATVITGTGSGNGAIVNIGGNNTMAGAVNLGGNATIGATVGQLTMSGNITNSGSVFTISPAANSTNIFSGVLTGTGSISKSGTGVVIFSGASANDFSGTITITAGTMKLSKNAGVDAIAGNVTISTGGTLLMGASNQFAAGSNMTLNGGTFTANSFSEGATTTVGLGTLTLTENSTIDLSGTAEVIHFAASNGTSWTAGKTLEIKNFDNGTDIIAVGTDATGLDSTQLSQISFRDPTGWTAGTYYGAAIDSNGHLTIVPEPGTIASAFLISSLLAWHKRRKQKL